MRGYVFKRDEHGKRIRDAQGNYEVERGDCENCGERFKKHQERQRYCSGACRVDAWRRAKNAG